MSDPGPPLDPFSVDALLDGAVDDDASLVQMLQALTVDGLSSELAGETSAVASIVSTVHATAAASASPRGIRRLTTRTGALAVAGAIALTGVAAAATGIPVPIVQDFINGDADPALVAIVDDDDSDDNDDQGQDRDDETNETDDPQDPTPELEEQTQSVVVTEEEPSADDKVDTDSEDDADVNHGAVVSEAAQSFCGKTDLSKEEKVEFDDLTAERVLLEEAQLEARKLHTDLEDEQLAELTDLQSCPAAENHGEYVSEIARQKRDSENGKSADAKENGKSDQEKSNNGKPGRSEDTSTNDTGTNDTGSSAKANDKGNSGGNGKGPKD